MGKVKYLGYAFGVVKANICFMPSQSQDGARLKELTSRSNGWGYEYRKQKLKEYILGWMGYYHLAEMKNYLLSVDEWLAAYPMCIWKAWKRVRTKVNLIKCGIDKNKATCGVIHEVLLAHGR